MQSTSPPLLVTIIGRIVIVSIPVSFFAFGWKNFELDCQRIGYALYHRQSLLWWQNLDAVHTDGMHLI